MRKFYIIGLIGLAAVIIGLAWAEQITLSTYYPAPCGVYRDFEAKRNAVFATEKNAADEFIGKVGIGTTNPAEMLEVVNGRIKATGGLIIEVPIGGTPGGTLENGQIWLDTTVNVTP